MTAGTGEQVAVLLLRAALSALEHQDCPNDLQLANRLLEELDAASLRDGCAFVVHAIVAALDHAPDLDVDEFLGAVGMHAAMASVGL